MADVPAVPLELEGWPERLETRTGAELDAGALEMAVDSRFRGRASQVAFDDYLGPVQALAVRRDQLEREIAALLAASRWGQTAARLNCLRGIDTLTAAGL